MSPLPVILPLRIPPIFLRKAANQPQIVVIMAYFPTHQPSDLPAGLSINGFVVPPADISTFCRGLFARHSEQNTHSVHLRKMLEIYGWDLKSENTRNYCIKSVRLKV